MVDVVEGAKGVLNPDLTRPNRIYPEPAERPTSGNQITSNGHNRLAKFVDLAITKQGHIDLIL